MKKVISLTLTLLLCLILCACGGGGIQLTTDEVEAAFDDVDGTLDMKTSGKYVRSFTCTVNELDTENCRMRHIAKRQFITFCPVTLPKLL